MEASHDFRGPFALPGASLFRDFCHTCIKRYCLDGLVTRGKVSCYCRCNHGAETQCAIIACLLLCISTLVVWCGTHTYMHEFIHSHGRKVPLPLSIHNLLPSGGGPAAHQACLRYLQPHAGHPGLWYSHPCTQGCGRHRQYKHSTHTVMGSGVVGEACPQQQQQQL